MLDQDTDLQSAAEADTKRSARLSVNGCVMLQALLAMPQSACSSITDELLALDPTILRFIATDVSGSRAIEALIKVCNNHVHLVVPPQPRSTQI